MCVSERERERESACVRERVCETMKASTSSIEGAFPSAFARRRIPTVWGFGFRIEGLGFGIEG